jgi:peptidoglycan/xylan/chitin deacetylase (PgdA/CDA1 family)
MSEGKPENAAGRARGRVAAVVAALAAAASLAGAQAAPARPPWPEGKIAALTLGFDLDAETVWWADPSTMKGDPSSLSHGRYGPRVAVPKILDLLERHRMRATFFVPSWVAENYPQTIKAIVAAGHEIGAHGERHESPAKLAPEEEARVLRDSRAALERVAGVKPVGYRAPSWALSDVTLDLVAREGFLYSSNLMDSDLPYVHDKPAGLVELPVSWTLDDAPQFWFDESTWTKSIASAAAVEALWKEEFAAVYEQGGYFNLTMHPQFIGRPARLKMLDEFLRWVEAFPAVWIASGEEVARRVREAKPAAGR